MLDQPAPRFIVSDIDGTILDGNHRVTKRTREVITRAVDAGARFALATGRPHRWIAPVLEQLPVRPVCVTANGAVLFDSATDQVLLAHELQPAVLAQVIETAQSVMSRHGGVTTAVERAGETSHDPLDELFVVDPNYSESPLFDGFGVAEIPDLCAVPAVKLLLRNDALTAPELYGLIAPHVDPADAHVTYSMNEGLIEVAAPGVTKAHGLAWLAQHYGVTAEETVAFGDMPNDIEMLTWAGMGVAMGNAAAAVKAAADHVTVTNRQSGVAAVLETWF